MWPFLDLPANAFYFLAYEYIQDKAKEQTGSEKISVASTIFAGGAAGIAYWLVGMPADVLKSRLQTGICIIDIILIKEYNIYFI